MKIEGKNWVYDPEEPEFKTLSDIMQNRSCIDDFGHNAKEVQVDDTGLLHVYCSRCGKQLSPLYR